MILLLHKISICFNTSHVVVYRNGTERKNSLGRFQYISCCSLSIKPIDLQVEFKAFQYISCCSLSNQLPLTLRNRKQFQYISCCSLSNATRDEYGLQSCFNTSHVVVYRT